MNKLITWILWPYLLAAALPAWAGDRITSRAVLEDASASQDFHQIVGQTFTPFSGILSRGYGPSALWIRLHIVPDAEHSAEPLVLRIRPGYLDEIRLYDPEYLPVGYEVSGDTFPITQDRYRSLNSNFVIP